jgi:hypothetical protein
MGTFSWIYPDNQKRANRVSELANDCSTMIYQLANDKKEIDESLTKANNAIKEAYQNLAQTSIPFETVDIGEDWKVPIAKAITSIFASSVVANSLMATSRAVLLREGRIAEAAFARQLRLPRWMRIGKVMGGAIVTGLLVEGLLDLVDGSDNCKRLQEATHELIPARVDLKKKTLINAQVRETLGAVMAAFNGVKKVSGITKDQLDQTSKNIIDEYHINTNLITDDTARAALAALDASRGSWTNEDN